MHHQKPLSNFSKRLILFDLIFQTYEPPKSEQPRDVPIQACVVPEKLRDRAHP